MLMSTFSQAPWMAARRDRADTPRSLAALSLVLPSSSAVSSRVSTASSIISKGVAVQPSRPFWMAAERAVFSSSVALGMPKAALTTLKASVSRSITSTKRAFRSSAFFWLSMTKL